ncbi:MAG: serine hydrolase, partial [Blautia wexlerae]|nr:serine hydrolase [Blautia wexlerae]
MDIKEKISKVMKQAVDHCELMGVNLLVEKGGEELLYCEEGMADRENRRLISRDTIF